MNLPDHLGPPEGGYKRLKPTPDINGPIIPPTPDELEEFKILWDYENSEESSQAN